MKISSIKKFMIICCLLNIVFAGNVFATCSTSNGDADINVSFVRPLLFGTLTTPDAGAGSIIISAINSARTIPTNLSLTPHNSGYQSAKATISGQSGCQFKVTIIDIASGLSAFTLYSADAGLNNNQSGAIGTISNMGQITIFIGAALSVSSGSTSFSNNIFKVNAEYF